YMYYVLDEQHERPSDQSNLVAFPLLGPAMTFTQLNQEIDRWQSRGRIVGLNLEIDRRHGHGRFFERVTRLEKLQSLVSAARTSASRCQITDAINTLASVNPARYVLEPEATDFEILIAKLVRRLTLFDRLPADVISDEFCQS